MFKLSNPFSWCIRKRTSGRTTHVDGSSAKSSKTPEEAMDEFGSELLEYKPRKDTMREEVDAMRSQFVSQLEFLRNKNDELESRLEIEVRARKILEAKVENTVKHFVHKLCDFERRIQRLSLAVHLSLGEAYAPRTSSPKRSYAVNEENFTQSSHEKKVEKEEAEKSLRDSPSMETLVHLLEVEGFIQTVKVSEVMKRVDRRYYCTKDAYSNREINDLESLLGAPRKHAQILEIVHGHLSENCRVLKFGLSSGYLTTCLLIMIGPSGMLNCVYKSDEDLARFKRNAERDKANQHCAKCVKFVKKGTFAWQPEFFDVVLYQFYDSDCFEMEYSFLNLLTLVKPGGCLIDAADEKLLIEKKTNGSRRIVRLHLK